VTRPEKTIFSFLLPPFAIRSSYRTGETNSLTSLFPLFLRSEKGSPSPFETCLFPFGWETNPPPPPFPLFFSHVSGNENVFRASFFLWTRSSFPNRRKLPPSSLFSDYRVEVTLGARLSFFFPVFFFPRTGNIIPLPFFFFRQASSLNRDLAIFSFFSFFFSRIGWLLSSLPLLPFVNGGERCGNLPGLSCLSSKHFASLKEIAFLFFFFQIRVDQKLLVFFLLASFFFPRETILN